MKLNIIALTVFLCWMPFASQSIFSQECTDESFALMKEGAEVHYQVYDKGEEVVSVTKSKVTDVKNVDGKTVATIEVNAEKVTKKGKENDPLPMNRFEISCENGKVNINFRSLLPAEQMQQMKDVEVEITGTDVQYPEKLTPGQQLPDAEVKMSMKMGEMNMFGTTISITERKVEAEESITTPAGTFKCVRMSSVVETKFGFIKSKLRSVEWLAPGIGMVKSESYNKKDKLESRTELIFLKK